MFLDKNTFTTVIDSTPLVSIDLLVENSQGQFLLGLRNNKPAQGFWFVPGGRVLKNETLDDAFTRLGQQELGVTINRSQAACLGPFEHFYTDSVFGDEVSTHYVVLGYKIRLDIDLAALPAQQHQQYRWFTREEMISRDDVHKHSAWYID
ncbi:GDP-mannose mannosyl hydrolase [Shewanella metallivivens]|uniref:GDP-mannose mannosyl hydrolase n=1 Tax=Shewanella metallivivens TaxID=2872342 RepID=A0ABT5TPH7_9GAMM|nr:GDP-mannose mannosyl hydrolase [Shewanella metallivivens]MDD8059326.1 GDP-mannose mannosyl hydrolase [Shewanella metallivivens]